MLVGFHVAVIFRILVDVLFSFFRVTDQIKIAVTELGGSPSLAINTAFLGRSYGATSGPTSMNGVASPSLCNVTAIAQLQCSVED